MSEDQKVLSIEMKGICKLRDQFKRRSSAPTLDESNMARFDTQLFGERALSEAQTFTMSSDHFSELVSVFHSFRYKPPLTERRIPAHRGPTDLLETVGVARLHSVIAR